MPGLIPGHFLRKDPLNFDRNNTFFDAPKGSDLVSIISFRIISRDAFFIIGISGKRLITVLDSAYCSAPSSIYIDSGLKLITLLALIEILWSCQIANNLR